jgi:hypothetical protein
MAELYAANGGRWFYENEPGGGDFGDAAFEHTDSPYNPYTVTNGFLRIRSQYDPNYVDPYGYGRHWYSGLLATAFPDGSTNVPNLGNHGYYEARILVPNAAPNGGSWPAWWTLNLVPTSIGASSSAEYDIMEQYGDFPTYTTATAHAWGSSTGGGWYNNQPMNGADITWDFHRFGLLVTDTLLTVYFDDVALATFPAVLLPGNTPVASWFLLLNLAMGGGWQVNPPPGGYYDMWIDYVRYYAP